MPSTTFIRNPYNYPVDLASLASGLVCEDPPRTQQHFKDECDINTIVRRFGLTGQMPDSPVIPHYGDFSEVFDFQTAQNAIAKAREDFMTLPARLRDRFNHDPQQLLRFVEDPYNRKEGEALGLFKPSTSPGMAPSSASPAPQATTPA